MTTTQIFDTSGQAQTISSKTLTFRPAVYGIFIEHDQILLLRNPETQLLQPPGRIIAENETPSLAVRLFFNELANITPILGPLLYIETQYRQENGQDWQLSTLYYAIKRSSIDSISFADTQQHYAEWLQIDNLYRTQFQFGYEAIQAGKLHHHL